MDDELFNNYQKFIYKHSGISLADNKKYLVESRIRKRLIALQLNGAREYFHYLTGDASGTELVLFINAISTNTTSFFREAEHFKILDHKIDEWIKAGQKKFRIWCAAASSGEEPYTIAMTCLESIKNKSVDLKILATDISTNALKKAVRGCYEPELACKIPDHLKRKYFNLLNQEDGTWYEAKDILKKYIIFRHVNLDQFNPKHKNAFDIIFCRNLMYYFDQTAKQRLLDKIISLLRPGGFLFISQTETLSSLNHSLQNKSNSIYFKPLLK